MKGVILAGGHGTRLYPLTHATNKHLLPVYDKPMIFYPIRTLVEAGIKELMVVVGGPHAGNFIRILKNGKEFGLDNIEYAYQEDDEKGIAGALKLTEDFADGGSLCVILGDNCTDAKIGKELDKFEKGATVFLKEVTDPERFGVPVFDDKQNITRIEEKPKKPKSTYAVTGLYIYDNSVFDKIRKIQKSARGELEITDVNNLYIKEKSLRWAPLQGFWKDAGTFDTLFEVNYYWADKK